MLTRAVYYVALALTVLATLNFVWMGSSPGVKQNLFAYAQKWLRLSREQMRYVYLGVGFAALLTVVMSVGYVRKADECSAERVSD